MPRKVVKTVLDTSTVKILNTIRQNASAEYQSLVPSITKASDIPAVGDVIYGNPSLSNQFLGALINRIALVMVQSATFNNMYASLKKGYLEYGEVVEDIFVAITKANVYNPEKAEAEEFKRTLPDVRSAFHTMNWRVKYPITIQDEDLRQAFLSVDGVQDLITRIIDAVYTASEYDEFLLFKYMLIKSITKGELYPVAIGATMQEAATTFRATSNKVPFMSSTYNEAGVPNTLPKERQNIFMSADFNAQFDVEVLSAAFHMDKADFMGKLHLIDDWTTFDNERFAVIRNQTDGLEEVTEEELALMSKVKAVLIDSNWFQVYDNLSKMTEKYVASGLYWNYFYHTWKTISHSPFANAIVFVDDSEVTSVPEDITVEITGKDISETATVLTLGVEVDGATLVGGRYNFCQCQTATANGIAIHKYGAVIIPADKTSTEVTLELEVNGNKYTADSSISTSNNVGDTVTMSLTSPLALSASTPVVTSVSSKSKAKVTK